MKSIIKTNKLKYIHYNNIYIYVAIFLLNRILFGRNVKF